MGRPAFEMTDAIVAKIELLAGYGLTVAQIAAVIGIAETTLNGKRANERRVNVALAAGRAKAEARVGKSLFERAVEGDVAAIRWWEMTRAKRSAEVKVEQKTEARVIVSKTPDWRALIGSGSSDEAEPT